MIKIRFTLNQCGMALEYWKDKAWRCACLVSPENITANGGWQSCKSKMLMGITQRYELVQAGEYIDGNGVTVQCI